MIPLKKFFGTSNNYPRILSLPENQFRIEKSKTSPSSQAIDALVFDVSTVIRLKNAVIHRECAKDESLLK